MAEQEFTYHNGEFNSLPLYILRGITLEPIKKFSSGKVSFKYHDPKYDPYTYKTKPEVLRKIDESSKYLMTVINDWRDHFASYLYYVQFEDDQTKSLINHLHNHTELVSSVCDTRFNLDTADYWNAFDSLINFELIHSEYRNDKERSATYENYAKRLKIANDKLSDYHRSAIRLSLRLIKLIELNDHKWHNYPPLSTDITQAKSLSKIQIFYSYSHQDEQLRNKLDNHLAALKHQGKITNWHDRCISGGQSWEQEIDNNLISADIILLLISSNFLSSDYCMSIESKRALELHNSGKSRVIPIILSDCDWKNMEYSKLQALPKDAKPITSWKNEDEAFCDVALGIRKVIEELNSIRHI